jgi:hypothetical protein
MNHMKTRVHDLLKRRLLVNTKEVKVAVLDTGIDTTLLSDEHKERVDKIEPFGSVTQGDIDVSGHGTQVASIVLQSTLKTKICVARVFSEPEFDVADVTEGVAEVLLRIIFILELD